MLQGAEWQEEKGILGRRQITQSLEDHGHKIRSYSKGNGKPLKSFKQ